MKQAIKNTTLFLIVLFCNVHVGFAIPSQNQLTRSDDSISGTNLREDAKPPRDSFKNPGILPCPDQSRMTKEKDLARLENHSKDCGPSAGGAIRTQPDRPDGEVKDSDLPTQFR